MDTNLQKTIKNPDTAESEILATETETVPKDKVTIEEFKISGDTLVAKIKELIHQGILSKTKKVIP